PSVCTTGVRCAKATVPGIVILALASCASPARDRPPASRASVGIAARDATPSDPAPCPVTQPGGGAPPGEQPDPMFFGNGRLWTVLWPKGMVFVPPVDVEPDGFLSMKFPWWRGPGVHGLLSIAGSEIHRGLAVRARASG